MRGENYCIFAAAASDPDFLQRSFREGDTHTHTHTRLMCIELTLWRCLKPSAPSVWDSGGRFQSRGSIGRSLMRQFSGGKSGFVNTNSAAQRRGGGGEDNAGWWSSVRPALPGKCPDNLV